MDILPLSHSKKKLAVTCGLAFLRRYGEHAPAPVSPPAETGTAAHSWAQDAQGAAEHELFDILARKAALLEEPQARDLRQIIKRVIEKGGLPRLPSDATQNAEELAVAVDPNGKRCEWDSPAAMFRARLDQFFIENEGTLACIRDWKTNRVIEAPGEQMRLYAWIVKVLFPEVREIVVELHFLRYGAVRKAVYDEDALGQLVQDVPLELNAVAEELRRREQGSDWKPRVSGACDWCEYRAGCPAFAGEVKPLLVLETPEQARAAADRLTVLRGQAAEQERALKAWVVQHGPVECEGERVGFRPGTKTNVVDVHAVARSFKALGDGRIWAALSLKKGDLAKLLTAAVKKDPRSQRWDAKERLLEGLRAAGALEVRPTATFARFKPADEEPEVLEDGSDEEEA